MRRKPYSVVLFDEIEKAHPDVFNTLLQVLDDGRLTDNKGRTVNFKNTIIIMTSNIGSQYIRESLSKEESGERREDREKLYRSTPNFQLLTPNSSLLTIKNHVLELLRQTVRPEFLNRIDETIMFLPLSREQIASVVRLQMSLVATMLQGQGFELRFTDAAVDLLADEGYDPEFGARPVKRAIQRLVLNPLSRRILAGELDRERAVVVDAQDGALVMRNEE